MKKTLTVLEPKSNTCEVCKAPTYRRWKYCENCVESVHEHVRKEMEIAKLEEEKVLLEMGNYQRAVDLCIAKMNFDPSK